MQHTKRMYNLEYFKFPNIFNFILSQLENMMIVVGFSRTSYNDNPTNSPYNMQGSWLLERVYSFMTYTYLIFMYSDNDINVMPEQEIMALTQFYLR